MFSPSAQAGQTEIEIAHFLNVQSRSETQGGKKEVKLTPQTSQPHREHNNSATDSSPVSVASSFDFIRLGSDNTFKSKMRLGQHCFMHPAWEYNERSWKPVQKALPADRTGNAKEHKMGAGGAGERKTAGRYRD